MTTRKNSARKSQGESEQQELIPDKGVPPCDGCAETPTPRKDAAQSALEETRRTLAATQADLTKAKASLDAATAELIRVRREREVAIQMISERERDLGLYQGFYNRLQSAVVGTVENSVGLAQMDDAMKANVRFGMVCGIIGAFATEVKRMNEAAKAEKDAAERARQQKAATARQ